MQAGRLAVRRSWVSFLSILKFVSRVRACLQSGLKWTYSNVYIKKYKVSCYDVVCGSNVSLSICSSYSVVFIKARKTQVEIPAVYEGEAEGRGAARKQWRYTLKGWRLDLERLGPIRRRMGWALAANQVSRNTDTSLSWRQSGPRLHMIIIHRDRQLCVLMR